MTIPYRWTFAALAMAFLWCSPSARAVIVDGANGTGSANTTAPFPVAGLNNVGIVQFNPASTGVYIGNGWGLTAAHIGPAQNFPGATFTVAGGNYTIGSVVQLTNSDSTVADLVAFQLTTTPNLPTLRLSIASPAVGSDIYAMGDGFTRSATLTVGSDGYPEYTESSPSVLRYGTSITSAPPTVSQTVSNNGTTEVINVGFGNTTIFASSFTASSVTGFNTSSSVLSSGDSGGAVFGTNNTLLGINDLGFSPANQNADTAAYGDDSGYVDIATYASDIASVTGVPEPTTLSLLLGAMPLLLRRRNAGRLKNLLWRFQPEVRYQRSVR